MRYKRIVLAGSAAVVIVNANLAHAQPARAQDTTSFMITLVDMPAGERLGPIVIERRAVGEPRFLVMVDRNEATVKDMSSALNVVEGLERSISAGNLQRDVRAVVSKKSGRPIFGGEKMRMERYFQALAEGSVGYVRGVGRVRSVDIRIPRRAFANVVESGRR